MGIKLRVVGIFYRTEIELEAKKGTVKDVLLAAQSQISGGTSFSFNVVKGPDGKESPSSFRAFYEAGFKSHASGIEYEGGEYFLAENLNGNPYTVWQYYIVDEHGVVLNRDKGFIPYDDEELAVVEDGQSVIWRLVSVLKGPSGTPTRYAKQLA